MSTVYQLTVSPDFMPSRLAGWYVFNTWLQKHLNIHSHLELYDHFEAQRSAIRAGTVDMIYANPWDASLLIREKGFLALARASGVNDECVVVVPQSSPIQAIEELQQGVRVVSTDDPDINMLGMMLLEPADLSVTNITLVNVDNYVLAAKSLLNGSADVGLFPKDSFNEFSEMLRKQLRPLVFSQIADIQHVMLIGPRLANQAESLNRLLVEMSSDKNGKDVLEAMGFSGWIPISKEDSEFMIDMIDTLKAR